MKTLVTLAACVLAGVQLSLAQIKAVDVKGDVRVRHGVDREWRTAQRGLELKPDDSMMAGKRSRALILVNGKKRVVIPENAVVDLVDFRVLSRQELLLQLAMERIRSVPAEERNDPGVPQTTISHGSEQVQPHETVRSLEFGRLQLNGARVLFDNGYYATCALRTKEVLRLYPELSHDSGSRLMVAAALEKENLHGEALTEYSALMKEKLSPKEKAFVQQRVKKLRK